MTCIRSLTAGVLSALMILIATQANGQAKFNAPAPKLAIVDVQAIMREALSAKSVREQMDAIARREQAVLAEEEKVLRTRDQELQQQRALLTPELYEQRRQALQADIGSLQQKSRKLRLALDQGFRQTMDQVQLVLADELRKLSTEFGLNVILARSQIVIAVDDFDITKTALKRLNERLPSVELKLEKSENTGTAQ